MRAWLAVQAAAKRCGRARRTPPSPSARHAAGRPTWLAGSPALIASRDHLPRRRRKSGTRRTKSRPAPPRRATRGAPMPSVKLLVRTVLSLAMSAVFVWLSLRHTDVRAVGRALAQADAARINAYGVLVLGLHLVRTVLLG